MPHKNGLPQVVRREGGLEGLADLLIPVQHVVRREGGLEADSCISRKS